MKFYASDIIKMGGAALITALIFLATRSSTPAEQQLQAQQSPEPLVLTFSGSTSGAISWASADSMRRQWISASPLKTNDGGNTATLQAFSFNARQIDTIINHNLNPINGDSTADDLFIYFGQDSTFNSGTKKFGNIHLVLVGSQTIASKNVLMVNLRDSTSAKASSVYDQANPCPPRCSSPK